MVGKYYAKAAAALLGEQGTVDQDTGLFAHEETIDTYKMERYTYLLWNSMYYSVKTMEEGAYVHAATKIFFSSLTSMLQIMKDNHKAKEELYGCELLLERLNFFMEPKMKSLEDNTHDVDECSHCQVLLQRRESAFQTLTQLKEDLN